MTGRNGPGDSPGLVGELVRHVVVRLADRIGRRSDVLELLRSVEHQTKQTRGIADTIAAHLCAKHQDTPELVQLHCWLVLEPSCRWVADQQWLLPGAGAELGILNRTNSLQVFRWELRGPIDAVVGQTKSAAVTCLYGGTSGIARVPSGAQVTMMVLRASDAQTRPLEQIP